MDDAELLKRYCRDHSEVAFADLVRRHLPLVYSAALRRLGGDGHHAKDVAQQVFTALARQAPRLVGRMSLEGWLHTATRNIAIQTIRTERRRVARELAAMMNDTSDSGPEIDTAQLRRLIDPALDRLGALDREMVLLRFFSNQAFGEIAARFGVSEDAARLRCARSLERMRALLAKSGIRSTPAALALVLSEHATAATSDQLVHAIATHAVLHGGRAIGASFGVTQWLSIMTNTKAALVVTAAIASVGSLWIHHESTELQATRSELAARRTADQAKLAAPSASQVTSGSRRTSSLQASPATSPAMPAASLANAPSASAKASRISAPSSTKPQDEVNWTLSRDPQVRTALERLLRPAIHGYNATFGRAANLSDAQLNSLDDLCLQLDAHMGAATLTLRSEGQSMAQVESDIHALLGDSRYEQFQEYRKSQFVRSVASELAGQVYNSDTPLTAAQADQLTTILAESCGAISSGPSVFPKDINWAVALPRAQGVLSPAQYEALLYLRPIMANTPAALTLLPGDLGDGVNPPSAVYSLGDSSS